MMLLYTYPGENGSGDSVPNRSMSSDTSSYASLLTSGDLYPAPVGLLGSFEHIFGQIPQQQTSYMVMDQYPLSPRDITLIVDLFKAPHPGSPPPSHPYHNFRHPLSISTCIRLSGELNGELHELLFRLVLHIIDTC
ncbi:uncharacterized protein [Rutidosis leptorrhynchoides]|uniref:uncharacterized protein isoform X2 n=1 Tax=Rutidosis leptorrhynchoides TaxID=125765 RepID=UPI003A997620